MIVPRLVEEPGTAVVETYLDGCSAQLLISDFAAAEVASALSRLVRMRSFATAEASSALNDFEIWRAARCSAADVRAADARLAYAYVQRFDLMLRTPDALHLAISRRLDATLVTLDGRLANAARELGIAVVVPGTDTAHNPS
jgi:predicted nucleic acid-binding protein